MKTVLFAVLAFLTTTFAMAQDSYLIRPGDTLAIEVLDDPQLDRTVLILPDGRFSFPFAGTVLAGGRSIGQVQQALTAALAPNFAAPPTVFVTVRSLREAQPLPPTPEATIDVYMLGEVQAPGEKTVPVGTTFLQAMARSGGFTNFAAQRRVQLRRTNPQTGAQTVTEINYRALERGARLSSNVVLREGDIILVPERRLFE